MFVLIREGRVGSDNRADGKCGLLIMYYNVNACNFSVFWTELRCGVGQPEDSGGEDESGAPQPEQRRVAAQEEPRLPQQDLPSALQRIPHRRG